MTRQCSDCGKQICEGNKSGRCRSCFMANIHASPEINARRMARLKEAANDPAYRARMSERVREHCKKLEVIELRRANGKRNYHKTIGGEKARTAALDPEVIARRGRSLHETLMAWCPKEYRSAYRQLIRSGKPMAVAKALIHERMRKDQTSRLASTCITSAIDYLRRYTAILPRENGYLYGTAVLSPEQLVERALNKGWEPERWAA